MESYTEQSPVGSRWFHQDKLVAFLQSEVVHVERVGRSRGKQSLAPAFLSMAIKWLEDLEDTVDTVSGHMWTPIANSVVVVCQFVSQLFFSSYVFWKRCWFTRVQNLCLHPKLNRDPSMEIASSIDHERMKSMCRTRWNKYVQGRDHRCPKETIQIEYVYIFYISMQDSWWRKRELGKKWIDMANPPLVLPSILDAAGKEYLDHSARLDLDVSHWII